MEQPDIIIRTTMSKEDYRKFLYIATFRRNKRIIPSLGLISLIAGLFVGFESGALNLTKLIISWIVLFALAIAVVVFKVERRNAQRIRTDKTGAFDSINTLKFYEDRIVFENQELKSTGELKYSQFHALLESKDYFIFYLTANQASMVRKKDVEDLNEFRELLVKKFENKYKTV